MADVRDMFVSKTKVLGIETNGKLFEELQAVQKRIETYNEETQKDIEKLNWAKIITQEYHSLENYVEQTNKRIDAMKATFKQELIVVKKDLINGKLMDPRNDEVDLIAEEISKIRNKVLKDTNKRIEELKPDYDVAIEFIRANNARFEANKKPKEDSNG